MPPGAPGGDRRDRATDILLARQALSQPGYGPRDTRDTRDTEVVAEVGFEPTTFRL